MKEKRIKEEYFNSIKQQMGIKGIDNKTIGEQMMKMFGKQNSKSLSEEELKALLDWATAYEVAS